MTDNTKDFLIRSGKMVLAFMWLIAVVTNTITIIGADGLVNGIINLCALGMAFPTLSKWVKEIIGG